MIERASGGNNIGPRSISPLRESLNHGKTAASFLPVALANLNDLG
ncbi:MAG: hypothetical protein WA642_09800 [Steroidobacteraceae bacterium]